VFKCWLKPGSPGSLQLQGTHLWHPAHLPGLKCVPSTGTAWPGDGCPGSGLQAQPQAKLQAFRCAVQSSVCSYPHPSRDGGMTNALAACFPGRVEPFRAGGEHRAALPGSIQAVRSPLLADASQFPQALGIREQIHGKRCALALAPAVLTQPPLSSWPPTSLPACRSL